MSSPLADLTLREVLDRFAAPTPTPGGGSAAAMAGALGASLLAMVAGLPKTKTGGPEERAALDAARAALLDAQRQLVDLIDRDAAAYDAVTAAYRLPKNTDDEKTARKRAIQTAMEGAARAPLQTMRACKAAVDHATAIVSFGSPSAVTDIAVGINLIWNGAQGALLNIDANLDGLDPAVRDEIVAEVKLLSESGKSSAKQIFGTEFVALYRRVTDRFGLSHGRPPEPQA